MNVDNRKTALDDEAALYKHETDHLTEKEKFQSMNAAQKWQQFKQYYLLKIVFALAGVGILVAILVSVFTPKKKDVLYACVFDVCVGRDMIYTISDNFEKSIELDTEKYQITFDMDFIYSSPYCDAVQRFAMLSKAGTVSVALMTQPIFEKFAASLYFEDLSEILTEEELEKYKNLLVYVSELDANGEAIEGTLKPYGIIIDGCQALAGNVVSDPVVIAISEGKKDDKYAKEFLKFLFANE